jgi:lipopolysaccharide/colanic/teichoic acid biosynthesis glycosyltransferase
MPSGEIDPLELRLGTMRDATPTEGYLAGPEGQDQLLIPRARQQGSYFAFKAILDAVLAAALLLLTSPVLLVCALLVKLTSRGPAFYSQVRLGLGGKPYWIYKLRSMYQNCESQSGVQWSQKGDPRVTPLGRFLRRTHLDELPQLWNILKGEMSLIGPRPERPEFIPTLAKAIPLYEARMAVRPGVTGLAQVQLPADSDLNSVRAKVSYDLYYVQHAGLMMDLRILGATVLKVFGASFSRIRRCVRMPASDAVEEHYLELQNPAAPRSDPEFRPELVPTS